MRAAGQPAKDWKRDYVGARLMRARALFGLKDPPGVLADLDLAMKQEADPGQRQVIQAMRARALIENGEHAKGVAQLEALVAAPGIPVDAVYALAFFYAKAVTAAREDMSLKPEEREKIATRYGDRAMELLKRARMMNYFADPGNVGRFGDEKMFDGMRGRGDFKSFAEEVGKKPGG
jgi:hypothetical protein